MKPEARGLLALHLEAEPSIVWRPPCKDNISVERKPARRKACDSVDQHEVLFLCHGDAAKRVVCPASNVLT